MSQAGIVNTQNIPPPPGSVTDLQGQDGVIVPPNGSGIIHVAGTVVTAGSTPFTTVGNAGTNTETWEIQRSQAIAATDATKIGLAAFDSAKFTVDGNGFVSTVGTSFIESVAVDAHTAPGTSPVVPNASGQITVTGAQVASGTTTNVIRTDSLAANTYTVQIQRSQAVASSTIGDNGVSHFNSSFFTVDANGFVSVNGSGLGETITGNTGGALSPTAGNWNILGAAVAAGTTPVTTAGSGSTLTVDVQRSQAIASTNASNVGLAAFNSTQFTVDGNGFVSASGTGLGQTITGNDGTALSPTAGNWNIVGQGVVGSGISTAGNIYTNGSGSTMTIHPTQAQFMTNYTSINNASSPYTVLATDYYISTDSTAGAIKVNLPNAPTTNRLFIIKDRTGQAAVNNVTLTTPGGVVTIDGLTSYVMNSNYQAVQLLFNGTSYEVY